MRVALFHNRYRLRGGEDVVVDTEEALLRSLGVEVSRMELDNAVVFGSPSIRAIHDLAAAPNNRDRARQVASFLRDTKSDVGHVHNWFPLFSPSIYGAHARAGVPVVQTLHNYRMGCAAGTMTRGGDFCNKCLSGDRAPAVEHRCYRESSTLTRVWKRVAERGWSKGTFHADVDRFFAPTQYVADTHVALGLPVGKVEILPHGVPDPGPSTPPVAGAGALFVGRLSDEKGVTTLLHAWKDLDVPLQVVGVGPLQDLVAAAAAVNSSIRYSGAATTAQVRDHMKSAGFVVSPHIAPETFGLVVVEAMAAGRSVIASDVGGPSTILTDGKTGRLVAPGNAEALREAIRSAHSSHDSLVRWGAEARSEYLRRFTLELHGERLLAAFEDVIRANRVARAA